jgi:hypothetical protein
MRNAIYFTHSHGLQASVPVELRYLSTALMAFDARPQDGREWVERALSCGVLADPVSQRDITEVLTMRDGQRLVDAGCDRSVLEALKQAAAGEAHVICLEEPGGDMQPYAGVLVQDDRAAWRLAQTIGAPGAKASMADATNAFESFVRHANALDAENEAPPKSRHLRSPGKRPCARAQFGRAMLSRLTGLLIRIIDDNDPS